MAKKKTKAKTKKKQNSPPEHILVPPQGIVVRASTDFFAVDDEQVESVNDSGRSVLSGQIEAPSI